MVRADVRDAWHRDQKRDDDNDRSLSCSPAPHRRETLPKYGPLHAAYHVGITIAVGKLVRRVLDGQEVLAEWSSSEPGSYEAAAAVFKRALAGGHAAARVDGPTFESVTELPEDAELVVVTTAMGGG
jgi:hypothetical protein